ncbi:AAA family ATPase [Litorivivens sp.]|uniref:AAA family ATPase n=1 Tax=Litorivivens sp. TaxID=2020868 RepID=UPI0035668D2D
MKSVDKIVGEVSAAVKSQEPRYRLLSPDDLRKLPPLSWCVQGILPSTGLAALYGPSASGKTFLALDLSAAIAEGQEWFGYRVKAAPVVYMALEGEAGFCTRAAAWESHQGRSMSHSMSLVCQPFALVRGPNVEVRDILDLSSVVPLGAVVFIDTLNRAAPLSDENSSREMGAILKASKMLQEKIKGLVVLVHHTGKDSSKGLRGHSSLFAAMDAALEITVSSTRHSWKIAKAKDGQAGTAHPFHLEVVELGLDEFGDSVNSCVVISECGQFASNNIVCPQGKNQQLIFEKICTLLDSKAPFSQGYPDFIPAGKSAVELAVILPGLAGSLVCEKRKQNERALSALCGIIKKGIFSERDGWLWRVK